MTLGPATFCQLVFTSMPAALACFSIRPSRSMIINGRKETPNCCAMVISEISARAAVLTRTSAAAAIVVNFILPPTLSLYLQRAQLQRILATDLAPRVLIDRCGVEPVGRVLDVF